MNNSNSKKIFKIIFYFVINILFSFILGMLLGAIIEPEPDETVILGIIIVFQISFLTAVVITKFSRTS